VGGLFFAVPIILITVEAGIRPGIWLQRRSPDPGKTPMTGTAAGSILGLATCLLAFSTRIMNPIF